MAFLSCEILVPLFQKQSMIFSTTNGKSPASAIQLMISEKSEQRLCAKIAGFFLLCVHHDRDAFARASQDPGDLLRSPQLTVTEWPLSEIKSHHQWLPLLLPITAPAASLLGYCPFAFFGFFIF